MLTLPSTDGARRVPFERSSLPVHSSIDVLTPDIEPPCKWELKRFQEEFSALKSIRMCGVNRFRCRNALCAQCSPKRVREHRKLLQARIRCSKPASALMWTATIASTPERPLAELWSELDALYHYMVSGNWLGRRVQGYVRCIEIERTAEGWHVHAHTLLVFEYQLSKEEVDKLSGEIKARYLKKAEALQIATDARGQDVRVIPIAQLSGAVNYVTKSHIGTGPSTAPGTRTPTMLLQSASDGDADALALFTELKKR